MTWIKVCCIQSPEEARMAVAAGARAIGLVARMPSGPGPIEDDAIAAIARTVPFGVATFLLTAETDADAIAAHQRRCGTNTVQLVDRVSLDEHARLRRLLPGIALVRVVHVVGPESVDEARAVAPFVDAVLLDSGQPGLVVKELGGTGRVHDWTISRAIRDAVDRPVFLAGGLSGANVGEAIRAVRPFGVDVCSRIRTDGRLDPDKLAALVRAVD